MKLKLEENSLLLLFCGGKNRGENISSIFFPLKKKLIKIFFLLPLIEKEKKNFFSSSFYGFNLFEMRKKLKKKINYMHIFFVFHLKLIFNYYFF